MDTVTPEQRLTISGGRTSAALYAIITAGDAHALVSVDGSMRFIWPSGRRTDVGVVPDKDIKDIGAEALQNALSVLKAGFEGTPVVHMVPHLASMTDIQNWFKGIGLEIDVDDLEVRTYRRANDLDPLTGEPIEAHGEQV